jgi:hypothetical protein
MANNSIGFVARGRCCRRSDLSGDILEVVEELASGLAGQNDAASHDAPHFRGLIPDGLINSDVCERYNDIAVYCGNPGHLASEQFFLMEGVF